MVECTAISRHGVRPTPRLSRKRLDPSRFSAECVGPLCVEAELTGFIDGFSARTKARKPDSDQRRERQKSLSRVAKSSSILGSAMRYQMV